MELVGSGERRNSGWEELKGMRWGREMVSSIRFSSRNSIRLAR